MIKLTTSQQAVIDAMRNGAILRNAPQIGAALYRSAGECVVTVRANTFEALLAKRAIKRPIKGGTEFVFYGFGVFVIAND